MRRFSRIRRLNKKAQIYGFYIRRNKLKSVLYLTCVIFTAGGVILIADNIFFTSDSISVQQTPTPKQLINPDTIYTLAAYGIAFTYFYFTQQPPVRLPKEKRFILF